ncbi:hypothetical protein PVLB_13945 [Pseudomonas sp. VLB120]|nr:hypothetical protein PVLB_13945 [Pseudomonas sp. VLB120]
MVNLGFLLIKHRRGGRLVAPQGELHHFQGHDLGKGRNDQLTSMREALKTVRVPEEHLDIHINQMVMNGKLYLYPQIYPF